MLPISACPTSFSRTMAAPVFAARMMMSSNSFGSVSIPWVVTTKDCWVPLVVGACPTWPTPNALFWRWMAVVTSWEVIPIWASRSGFSQMRMAMSGTGNMLERFAPGIRLIGSRT